MSVADRLTDLATCLCAQITTDGSPETCFCGVIAGEDVAQDYTSDCDDACGMAWVRLATAGPVTGINVVSEKRNNCDSTLGFDVEVGIIRCAILGENGEPPTVEDHLAMAIQQMNDMETMRRAIMCCDGDKILGLYTPVGPLGAVLGGFWLVSMVMD